MLNILQPSLGRQLISFSHILQILDHIVHPLHHFSLIITHCKIKLGQLNQKGVQISPGSFCYFLNENAQIRSKNVVFLFGFDEFLLIAAQSIGRLAVHHFALGHGYICGLTQSFHLLLIMVQINSQALSRFQAYRYSTSNHLFPFNDILNDELSVFGNIGFGLISDLSMNGKVGTNLFRWALRRRKFSHTIMDGRPFRHLGNCIGDRMACLLHRHHRSMVISEYHQ